MDGANPMATILATAGGYALPRCLHVVADLGVADALDEAPRPAAELAAAVGANPDALARAIRLLAAHGIFALEDGAIGHTPASRLLRDDHPQSLRALARMFGLALYWESFQGLEQALRTGQPALTAIYPAGAWEYFTNHPPAGRIFDAAMAGKSHGQVAGIMAAYDFSACAAVADIGGGAGHLLRAVLDAAPRATGILFDLPPVIMAAAELASPRLSLQPGDFFRDPLPVGDTYVLMEIIHDWADAEALAILRAVRAASTPEARVLLIEQLVPDHSGPDWAKLLDIHMLALLGGRQRTEAEYAALLTLAGFRHTRTIDIGAGAAIVEATVA